MSNVPPIQKCPDGLLPDGETCPRCGGNRAPSGIDGGTWVHFEKKKPTEQPIWTC